MMRVMYDTHDMHENDSLTEINKENGATDRAGAALFAALAQAIKAQARQLGFADAGIAPASVPPASSQRLAHWLALGRHGGMDYMAKHAELRSNPHALLPGAQTVISVRLPYWPQGNTVSDEDLPDTTGESATANISRYARGRDYHKIVRSRLQKLADFIATALHAEAPETPFIYRVFSDSAPVMETEFAQRAGIGWRGKHTLTLTRAGSWHFLGEIYTNLPLPSDPPATEHCGDCRRCLDACPTNAIVAPYEVDARRCISYLTIELSGAIPLELRPLIGNCIYGCDDCQLVCPWNRFAQRGDPAFAARAGLSEAALSTLFSWSREEFETRLAGSPIRRIGHERWLRNIAVAIGNVPPDPALRAALLTRRDDPSALVREHVEWALNQQERENRG